MPYNPGVQSTAPQSLYAGASGFGKNLTSFLGDYIDRGRKSKGLDAVLTAYVPEGSEEAKALKSALPGMSLEEKQGLVQAHAVKDYQAREARANRLTDAQIGAYAGQEGERNARAEQDRAQGALPGEWMRSAGEPSNYVEQNAAPRGLNLASYVDAAGRTGAKLDPGILRDYMGQTAGGEPALSFEEDPITGNRYVRAGKQLLPSGINPGKASATAEDILDADGNIIGRGIRNPRGGFTMLPKDKGLTDKDRLAALTKQLQSAVDPAEKARLKAQIDGLMSGEGTSAGADPSASPAGGAPKSFGDSLWDKFTKSKKWSIKLN